MSRRRSRSGSVEKTLQRYHNRLIDAATVVAEMLRMKQERDATDACTRELGLSEEDVAFCDAIADNARVVQQAEAQYAEWPLVA